MQTKTEESGVIVFVLALVAFLIVIFGLSLAIDIPVSQSVAIDSQRAVDNATRAGINQLGDSMAVQQIASNTLFASLRGNYDGIRPERLFDFSRTEMRSYIPAANGSGISGFRWQSCSAAGTCRSDVSDPSAADPLYSRFQSALQMFDPAGTGIDDFNNAFTVFARTVPVRFLPTVSGNAPVEVVSTAMLRTAFVYLLIDPAFSIEGNYQAIFGPDHCSPPSDQVWPVASPRSVGAPEMSAGWTWPTTDALHTRPANGGRRTNRSEDECIYRFYAETCDTAPFWYFKRAAVSLVDRLAQSSAFSYTTLVGLTGYDVVRPTVWSYTDIDGRFYGYRIPLVPLHPKFTVSSPMGAGCPEEVASHFPSTGNAFPLQTADVTNRGLNSRKRTAYEGFVNTAAPALNANRIRQCDGVFPTVAGTGLNRWELCLCRGLYKDLAGIPDEFTTIPDETSSEDPLFSHAPREKRIRRADFSNWCDDDPAPTSDLVTSLNKSQSGIGGGESTRNLIGELAIRMDDMGMYQANTSPISSYWWVRPQEATTARTGWRDLGPSLRAASSELERGYLEYKASAPIGQLRPVDRRDRTIVAVGFSAWSKTTQNATVEVWGTLAQAQQSLFEDFRDALQKILCESRQQIILNFLPMSDFDRSNIDSVRGLIREAQQLYELESRGGIPSAGDFPNFNLPECLDVNVPIAPLQFFVHDWTDARFPGVDDNHKKLAAAEQFSREVPSNVLRLITQYDFRN